MLGYSDFRWKGDKLLAGSKNTGAKIITDSPVARYVSSRISSRHSIGLTGASSSAALG
jgi:hypothetical protein